jgi:hypothetical protein
MSGLSGGVVSFVCFFFILRFDIPRAGQSYKAAYAKSIIVVLFCYQSNSGGGFAYQFLCVFSLNVADTLAGSRHSFVHFFQTYL